MSNVDTATESPTTEQVTGALNVVEQALLAQSLGASDGTDVNTQIHKDVAETGGRAAATEDDVPVQQAKKAKKAAKKAADDDEEDEKEASKKASKKAADDDDENDKKEIAALKASMSRLQSELVIEKARPLMTKMLTARANAGATQEQLNSFSRGMYGKSLEEIQQRYNEDSIFIGKLEQPVVPEVPLNLGASQQQQEIPWIETASSTASGTLEEMLK